ncbi:hypothetical protein CONPUDRAFT_138035 [Coniophora puteana RWD-64-598 SS2]|uniref:F-box domain-containing protein n=1 Tax=Coniophora puteana (strain RWD-64-598) TaxID=741705 RepID=A0A5M3MLD1_CONPW|nr:uncharacterized protein CONPUDRAFT_138035 [Coniophora puteana RWD-64-598 SS2]EIW79837.1 hypothetical protein CONPUDRAFT_138035 [Coniophora puteana RWD-64-598 SS2]
MHACLEVAEMRAAICNNVADPPALLALAMTCRDFRDPALDELYYEIHSLAHLLMCMPRDLWAIETTENHGRLLLFRRAMLRRDWFILQTYACRVRIVHVNWDVDNHLTVVDPNAFGAVQVHSAGVLLPSLRHLWLKTKGDNHRGLLLCDVALFPHLFFAACLRTLTLHEVRSDSVHVLSAASLASPYIEDLDLSICGQVGEDILETLNDAASRLTKLRVLKLSLVEWKTTLPILPILTALAPLSSLEKIRLECHNQDKSKPTNPGCNLDTSPIPLKSLRTLELTASPCQVMQVMAALPDLPQLTRVLATFEALQADETFHQAMVTLAKALATSPVRNIALYFEMFYLPGLLSFGALRPLFKLHKLRHLWLLNYPCPSFDNAMLAELASAFPDLRSLSMTLCILRTTDPAESATNVTLEGLATLLRYCTKLQRLSMAANLTAAANPDVVSKTAVWVSEVHQTQLQRWEVCNSVIGTDDVKFVARTLTCIAPNLRNLELPVGEYRVHCRINGEGVRCWKDVEEQLEDYRFTRRYSRMRVASG